MNHPPIPPNCDVFYERENEEGVRVWWAQGLGIGTIELHRLAGPEYTRWRLWTSWAGRCAWLDEAERIGEPTSLVAEWKSPGMLWAEAIRNANEWKSWGLGEKWE